MYNLWDINDVKLILKKHGFSFSKAFGQNFIIDEEVCPAIVDSAEIGSEDCVIEIGPGIGVLTAELCKAAKKVIAIEIDKRLPEVLEDTLGDFDNVEIINDDVMKLDLKKLIEENFGDSAVHICANLPYYITSPIIMSLLEAELPIKDITVMVQKEAADRLCAEVGSREGGAVTAAVNYYAEAEKCFFVGRECFMPSPKVDSEVIKLVIRDNPPIETADKKLFFKVVKGAFQQRRKTAANSLSSSLNISKQIVNEAIESCGFAPDIRAERLTMADFAGITNYLYEFLR